MIERFPTHSICPICDKPREFGAFYTYADHVHGVGGNGGPDSVRMCRVCLFQHLARYYPGSPAYLAVGDQLTKAERVEAGAALQLVMEL